MLMAFATRRVPIKNSSTDLGNALARFFASPSPVTRPICALTSCTALINGKSSGIVHKRP